jgi:hypothetical protein
MAIIHRAPVAITIGSYTAILATTYARHVEIQEDGAAAPAGIRVRWPDGVIETYTPAEQPVILLGDKAGVLGAGANFAVPNTKYCDVESVAATGSIKVTEWN